MPDVIPIFIGGCPRSGTTLVGAILGAHPECVCVPESLFKTDVLRGATVPFTSAGLAQTVLGMDGFGVWGLDSRALGQELARLQLSYPEALIWLARQYGMKVGRSHARWWIDHTPYNVRHGVTLGQMFPAARFVHIVRDGRAVAASVLPLDWGPNTVERAATWWVQNVGYGLALESWGGAPVLHVRYEDLVRNPEATVRGIAAFIGLDYRPEMLRADGFVLPRGSQRQQPLIGSVPDPSRANAWESTLTAREVEIFEFAAGDVLSYLGYTVWFGARATRTSLLERFSALVIENYRERLINRRRFRRRLQAMIRAVEAERRGTRP